MSSRGAMQIGRESLEMDDSAEILEKDSDEKE